MVSSRFAGLAGVVMSDLFCRVPLTVDRPWPGGRWCFPDTNGCDDAVEVSAGSDGGRDSRGASQARLGAA